MYVCTIFYRTPPQSVYLLLASLLQRHTFACTTTGLAVHFDAISPGSRPSMGADIRSNLSVYGLISGKLSQVLMNWRHTKCVSAGTYAHVPLHVCRLACVSKLSLAYCFAGIFAKPTTMSTLFHSCLTLFTTFHEQLFQGLNWALVSQLY